MFTVERTRRAFITAATVGAVMSKSGPALADDRPARPKDVGRKFYADGRVRPFAGNTIICHLAQQGAGFGAFDHLLDIYRELPVRGFARKVAALPPSSYHMTIFGGANDQGRDSSPWPADIALDAPIGRCNEILSERAKTVRIGGALPFRMVVDERDPPSAASPITLHLRPADDGEAAKLRKVRDRLADALQMRGPDHDHYQFHITIGYQMDWFTPEEQAEYAAAMKRWRQTLKANTPVFEFGAPEFCVFDDMFAFQRLWSLPV